MVTLSLPQKFKVFHLINMIDHASPTVLKSNYKTIIIFLVVIESLSSLLSCLRPSISRCITCVRKWCCETLRPWFYNKNATQGCGVTFNKSQFVAPTLNIHYSYVVVKNNFVTILQFNFSYPTSKIALLHTWDMHFVLK